MPISILREIYQSTNASQIIGVPELVSQTCLLLNDTLAATELSNCTHITGRAYATFDETINGLSGGLTGANALDVSKIGIDQALLTNNVSLLTDAYGRVGTELQIKNGIKVDGIRADGSFGSHHSPLVLRRPFNSPEFICSRSAWWYYL